MSRVCTQRRPDSHADGTFSDSRYEGELTGTAFADWYDITLCVVILMNMGSGILSILAHWPMWIRVLNMFTLATLALIAVVFRMMQRPDHLRARQSDRLLTIATNSIEFLRRGLTEETAMQVCEIILQELPKIIAVALTDRQTILGFAGSGAAQHGQGREIRTEETKKALRENSIQVLRDIDCGSWDCPLRNAIIVPLLRQGQAIGTLKFYYFDSLDLTENELAMAQGLAQLLSVQLEVYALEQEAALVRNMELKALQAQINPHFLFNTLNTIASLIRTDPPVARELVLNFAQFYRHTLEDDAEEVMLATSLDFVLHYFKLEQARFGERLLLDLDIADELMDLPMPPFMLQPLVENCVAHGMRDDGSPLHIRVSARIENGEPPYRRVVLEVADDGKGMSAKDNPPDQEQTHVREGLGLALRNVRSRFLGFYGADATMDFSSVENVGTTVTYRIPYHTLEGLHR